MLTIEDSIALSDLSPEAMAALVKHDHLPESLPPISSVPRMDAARCAVICDDIAAARATADSGHVAHLSLALRDLLRDHLESGVPHLLPFQPRNERRADVPHHR